MNNAIAKIHVLKSQLHLDDDTYREILKTQTGKISSKDMTKGEQLKIIGYLNAHRLQQSNLAGLNRGELRTVIDKLLGEQGKHRNYAQEIATRMHKKSLARCAEAELIQVIDALRK